MYNKYTFIKFERNINIKDNLNENSEELRPGQRRSGVKHSEPEQPAEMSRAEMRAFKKAEKKQKLAEVQAEIAKAANIPVIVAKKFDQRTRRQEKPSNNQVEHKKEMKLQKSTQVSETMCTRLTIVFLSLVAIGIILILVGASLALANTDLFLQNGTGGYFFTAEAGNFYNGLGILGIGLFLVLLTILTRQIISFIGSCNCPKKQKNNSNPLKITMFITMFGVSLLGVVIILAGACLLIQNSDAFTHSSVVNQHLVIKSGSLYTGLGLEGIGIFFTLLPILVSGMTKLIRKFVIK